MWNAFNAFRNNYCEHIKIMIDPLLVVRYLHEHNNISHDATKICYKLISSTFCSYSQARYLIGSDKPSVDHLMRICFNFLVPILVEKDQPDIIRFMHKLFRMSFINIEYSTFAVKLYPLLKDPTRNPFIGDRTLLSERKRWRRFFFF